MKKILSIILSVLCFASILTSCAKNEPIILYEPSKPDIDVQENSFIEEQFGGQSYVILGEKYDGKYNNTYNGEYELQKIRREESETLDINWYAFGETRLFNFNDYKQYCERWNLEQTYTDENQKYAIVSYASEWASDVDIRLADVEINDKTINVYIDEDVSYGNKEDNVANGYYIIIPVSNEILQLKTSLIVSIDEYIDIYMSQQMTVDKPIIYFYPTETTSLTVKLGNENLITHSYPKYINGWNIIANPNGDLIDIDTGKNLYSLYYESRPVTDIRITDEGFVIKGEDTIEFLEEKLAILGLNEREAQEFIIYWLPKLETNEYNYIRFASQKEIEANMPIEFSTQPDSVIRVWMEFKGLNTPIEIREQELTTPQRNGFVVVEWGGTEIQ